MDGLGGNSWFSLLDQGKTYNQGFGAEEGRHLMAFVTPWEITPTLLPLSSTSLKPPKTCSIVLTIRQKLIKVTMKSKGVPSNYLITWTENHQERLGKLLDCLVEPPVLAFPDFSKSFILHRCLHSGPWRSFIPGAGRKIDLLLMHCIHI